MSTPDKPTVAFVSNRFIYDGTKVEIFSWKPINVTMRIETHVLEKISATIRTHENCLNASETNDIPLRITKQMCGETDNDQKIVLVSILII